MVIITHSADDQNRLAAALAAGEPFHDTGDTLCGRGPKFSDSLGELPDELQQQFWANSPQYVIYSYNTAIAWRTADGTWTVPDVTYSPTTTQHQRIVRTALAQDWS